MRQILLHFETATEAEWSYQGEIGFSICLSSFATSIDDTPFCNPHLTLHEGYKSNFILKIGILIVATRSVILFHQSNLDVVTIKLIDYKP